MTLKYPPDSDLRRLLRFEPDSGAIWLGDRRMVLGPLLGGLRPPAKVRSGGYPACWTLLGYASGYTSAFMGR